MEGLMLLGEKRFLAFREKMRRKNIFKKISAGASRDTQKRAARRISQARLQVARHFFAWRSSCPHLPFLDDPFDDLREKRHATCNPSGFRRAVQHESAAFAATRNDTKNRGGRILVNLRREHRWDVQARPTVRSAGSQHGDTR